ncbi:hypothetical protein B0H16DRAFT_1732292 [Mycena metata]|uniref:F-box domain-containing protein n=1 Tax=Mycena metata TaxID=1033252 RepID=A0AAD7MV34_9AGAR|nr:hypothetical protein B0H16DRAFT_1732292 [Mycena metata]
MPRRAFSALDYSGFALSILLHGILLLCLVSGAQSKEQLAGSHLFVSKRHRIRWMLLESPAVSAGVLRYVGSSMVSAVLKLEPIVTRFPNEIFQEVFEKLCGRQSGYPLSDLYRDRASLLRSSQKIRALVKACPSFWTTVLVDPVTNITNLRYCLEELNGRKFSVEVRVRDEAACEGSVEDFVTTAMGVLSPFFHRCSCVELSAASPTMAGIVLQGLSASHPTSLLSIISDFDIPGCSDYDPSDFNDIEFAVKPSFDVVFPPAISLTLTTGPLVKPTVVYHSSSAPSAIVTCPRNSLPYWLDMMLVLCASKHVKELMLDNVECVQLPHSMSVPATLAFVRVLVLVFNGRRRMPRTVARLIFPGLDTLKLVIETRADIDCASECRAILATVRKVVLVSTCARPRGLEYLFRLMYQVETLDFSAAALALWNEYYSACDTSPPDSNSTFYACPRLAHLVLPSMSVDEVIRLLDCRAEVGYAQVKTVNMKGSVGVFTVAHRRWFQARSICLSFGLA